MPEIPAELIAALKKRWSSKLVGALSVGLAFCLALILLGPIDFSKLSPAHWASAAAAAVVVAVVWLLTNRLPKTPRGKVGVVVAIRTEDEEYARRLRSDFIQSLRNLVESPIGRRAFGLVEYGRKRSDEVDSDEAAIRCLRRSRGRVILFGLARTRKVGGREQHVIDLKGAVLHAPIPEPVSKQFGIELSTILPTRLIFDKENDVFSFQLTPEISNAAALYFVAIAPLLSGELDYAEELFLQLETICQSPLRQFPTVARIRQLLPQRLSRVYALQAAPVVHSYFLRRDRNDLVRVDEIWAKLERYDPSNYGMKVGRALCAFALHRDLATSWRYVRACVGTPDGTWRYSGAFLHAYAGNLRDARKWYQLAVSVGTPDQTVPLQTEEFIYIVLDEEPDKYQLHYCLGLINYWAKNDVASARREFSQFLADCPTNRYSEERELAQ